MLLDGMGKNIIENHLDEKGIFRSHVVDIIKPVFLSTTVASTTSAITGLMPCEHAWLGWDCYYPQIDKNVTVFLNTIQSTDIPAAKEHVATKYTPYESVVSRLNKNGINAYDCMPFAPPFPNSFEKICQNIKELCKEPKRKYIYSYWGQPDGLLHRAGCKSNDVRVALKLMEKEVSKLIDELEDTLFIITADHGHIDTDYVCITDYPKIYDCLERMPSLEPRVLNIFVKEGREAQFEEEFNKEFGDKFILMPMEEAIEKKLMGTGEPHPNFKSMLGDYLAIAISNLSIFFDDEHWVSMHGSITEEEMLIPLIVFDK